MDIEASGRWRIKHKSHRSFPKSTRKVRMPMEASRSQRTEYRSHRISLKTNRRVRTPTEAGGRHQNIDKRPRSHQELRSTNLELREPRNGLCQKNRGSGSPKQGGEPSNLHIEEDRGPVETLSRSGTSTSQDSLTPLGPDPSGSAPQKKKKGDIIIRGILHPVGPYRNGSFPATIKSHLKTSGRQRHLPGVI